MRLYNTEIVKGSRARIIAWHILHLLLIASLAAVLLTLIIVYTSTPAAGDGTYPLQCYADGTIHSQLFIDIGVRQTSRVFHPSLALSITLAFGDLSFPMAKGIDIVWDLVVGRGG